MARKAAPRSLPAVGVEVVTPFRFTASSLAVVVDCGGGGRGGSSSQS